MSGVVRGEARCRRDRKPAGLMGREKRCGKDVPTQGEGCRIWPRDFVTE